VNIPNNKHLLIIELEVGISQAMDLKMALYPFRQSWMLDLHCQVFLNSGFFSTDPLDM
jgi:hypothetical protein